MEIERQEVLEKYIQVRKLLDEITEQLKTVEFTSEEITVLKSIASVIEDKVTDLHYPKQEKSNISDAFDGIDIPF